MSTWTVCDQGWRCDRCGYEVEGFVDIQINRAHDLECPVAAIRALRATWSAEVDAANDAGIETPTMPIRAAVGALDVLLGGEPA